jgi:hypothetical protein
MLVNNLVVNERPALTREERSAVRSLVHKAVRMVTSGGDSVEPFSRNHVSGKVGKVKRFHPRTGQLLSEKVRRVTAQ